MKENTISPVKNETNQTCQRLKMRLTSPYLRKMVVEIDTSGPEPA